MVSVRVGPLGPRHHVFWSYAPGLQYYCPHPIKRPTSTATERSTTMVEFHQTGKSPSMQRLFLVQGITPAEQFTENKASMMWGNVRRKPAPALGFRLCTDFLKFHRYSICQLKVWWM
jgi:hypothetical protein